MREYTVTLVPSGRSRPFPEGTILSDALVDMGVPLRTPCGGRGLCRRCRVRLGDDASTEVLACRSVVDRDVRVMVAGASTWEVSPFPGLTRGRRLGAAVDLGTTTVKVALVDVDRGRFHTVASFLNPQRRFGHDVVSRIAAAAVLRARDRMTGLIRSALRVCLEKALLASRIDGTTIETVVLSGNTTMLSLFFGLDVSPLGRYPYAAATRDFPGVAPGEVGLDGIVGGEVKGLPVFSAFLGADLVGALTLFGRTSLEGWTLFADLGTNGELFLAAPSGEVFAASCAMGPALEGMNISCGMSADDGAITRIRSTPAGLAFDMMGTGEPAGITGTALVDLIAVLLDARVIRPDGRLDLDGGRGGLPEGLTAAPEGDMKAVGLWGGLRLTQMDIRNVQLAKAAMHAASRLLMDAAGVAPADVRRVVLAGALGEKMDLEGFMRLGFLPPFGGATFEVAGNTSLEAALTACIDPGFAAQAAQARQRVREVVLSEQEAFQDVFISSLDFPGG